MDYAATGSTGTLVIKHMLALNIPAFSIIAVCLKIFGNPFCDSQE